MGSTGLLQDVLRPVMQDSTTPVAAGGGGASPSDPIVPPDWLLASGNWSDTGIWDDASNWMDGP